MSTTPPNPAADAGPPSPDAPASVELSHVGRTYRDGHVSVEALKDVSLVIQAGQFAVITGASGSGKSTLMNLIGCIDRPSTGHLRIGSVNVEDADDRELDRLRARSIGYVFQAFNLIPVLTARENVEYALRKTDGVAASRRQRALEMIDAVGLSAWAEHRPAQLSGGQRQRVAIARALVKRPLLVLADEPTANLDSDTGANVLSMLQELRRSIGSTVVMSTHDQGLTRLGDTVFTIRDGRLTGTSTPAR